ncbi:MULTISPECIES: hypothetical protein [Allobacillus]|uniref:Uncharacterized protein n=1 Tax=Allobacillus salarius TaxID=1955272 RepID=A0A556PME8_9BACI|nr:hypothetical protein [Allobacillus salarius]TSJ65528.1 hypothetical protein FPQ13_06900 [Allobacillus salarius]
MNVIVYPIEKWFCYYVIDELLKEGYEVFAFSEGKNKDCPDQMNDRIEQIQLAFGRNAHFHLEENIEAISQTKYGIFIDSIMEADVSRGIYLSNRINPVDDKRIKIISIENIEIDDDAFIQAIDQRNVSSKEAKIERLLNDGNGDNIDNDMKIKVSAQKLAHWIIVHGMKDMIPQQTYFHGKDHSKSIYFLS